MLRSDRRRTCASSTTLGVALAAALVAGLGACAADDGAPAGTPSSTPPAAAAPRTPSPAPSATRAPLPDVEVRSADLDALARDAVVEPVRLTIPSVDVVVPVDPVGVEADGQMEIPPHAERAGWYRFGPSPADDAGTAVVAAHVDSIVSAGLGPFARLGDVEEGDEVVVELEDGSTRTFRVTRVDQVAKAEAEWPRVFRRDGDHRLVLVTCGGTFQQDVRRYSDNVLVTAEPVG